MTAPTDVESPEVTPGGDGHGSWGPTGWTPSAAAHAGRHPVSRVVALGVGGVLTVVLLALSSFAAANVLVRTSERDSTTLEGEIVRAVIKVHGEVDIRAGSPGRAHIERRSTFGLSRPEITQSLEDGLLTVRATCDDIPGICSTDLDIDLPPDAEVSVDGERISATGLDGRVEASSEGGTITLTDLTGPIDVHAGGGAVIGEGLTSDGVRASVGAGAIDLVFARPPTDVDASTGAGSLVIVVPPDGQTYRVEATSGAGSKDVTVATDPTSPHRINASTGAGNLEVRYGPG